MSFVLVFTACLQLVLCTVSASMSTYGSAGVIHALGALCCHLRVIVMAAERDHEVKGTSSLSRPTLPLLLSLHLFSSVSPSMFSSFFTPCLCSRLAFYANLFSHFSLIHHVRDVKLHHARKERKGFIAETVAESFFMARPAYKSKIPQTFLPSFP